MRIVGEVGGRWERVVGGLEDGWMGRREGGGRREEGGGREEGGRGLELVEWGFGVE